MKKQNKTIVNAQKRNVWSSIKSYNWVIAVKMVNLLPLLIFVALFAYLQACQAN